MPPSERSVAFRRFRGVAAIAFLTAALAACATVPKQGALQESARYAANAKHDYKPPGPPNDPWGPYIHEASVRFDIPEPWIRALMHVESGGHEYLNGQPITSAAGAMGLMQVMPSTYDELRDRYNLGDDPYDPHDNIMAGVAYMREMYDIFGAPGFLAAYNAGPARLDAYLANREPLPAETRRYVAMIGPHVVGISPVNRSPADVLAYDQIPVNIPPGRRYAHPVMLARARRSHGGHLPKRAPVEVAQLPENPRRGGHMAAQQFALVMPPPAPPAPSHGGFHLITAAHAADAAPAPRGPATKGDWAIQVGAFGNAGEAHHALALAQQHAHVELVVAHPYVASVHAGRKVFWRARMTGMSRATAERACSAINHAHGNCIVLSPDAQS